MSKLTNQLKKHEGLRLKAYQDSEGIWTIGYGRNLQQLVINQQIAEDWLTQDLFTAKTECESNFDFFEDLDSVRQDVIVNMAFNLGINRLKKFKKTLKYLRAGEYREAAMEMLDSKWAKQVGNRAIELSEQMRTGCYAEEKKYL